MDEAVFQKRAGDALESLFQALSRKDFDADFNAGALAIEFEDQGAKFVVSPNSPVRQIWLSANVKSFKLDWDENRQEFVLPGTGEDLKTVVAGQISALLGEAVEL